MFQPQKIIVLCGGKSNEREVSLRSGNNVLKALLEIGYNAVKIDPSEDDIPKDADFAFIALHGTGGEDGAIQGMLEWLNIPYSGSGICASAIAFNKIITKRILIQNNIPTADFVLLNKQEDLIKVNTFPQVIKPALEGSSIGIKIVDDYNQLEEEFHNLLSNNYTQIFCETYIKGREITVSVMGDLVFPILELIPKNRFYDYEAKYTKGMTEFVLPASFSYKEEHTIKTIARHTYDIIGCKGAARIDMIVCPSGTPYVLEVNTIPGMTDTSDLPAQALAMGMPFKDLIRRIVDDSISS